MSQTNANDVFNGGNQQAGDKPVQADMIFGNVQAASPSVPLGGVVGVNENVPLLDPMGAGAQPAAESKPAPVSQEPVPIGMDIPPLDLADLPKPDNLLVPEKPAAILLAES